MYAISIIPVIWQLMGLARQVWYADDAAAGGGLLHLRDWWSGLLSFGRHFGYHVNVAKTLSRDTWLRLSTSLMVLESRLCLLVGPIWVHLSALGTSLQSIRRIAYLSGFKVYLICHHLLLCNPMLHLLFLCMAFSPNWTITSGLFQTSMISCLL